MMIQHHIHVSPTKTYKFNHISHSTNHSQRNQNLRYQKHSVPPIVATIFAIVIISTNVVISSCFILPRAYQLYRVRPLDVATSPYTIIPSVHSTTTTPITKSKAKSKSKNNNKLISKTVNIKSSSKPEIKKVIPDGALSLSYRCDIETWSLSNTNKNRKRNFNNKHTDALSKKRLVAATNTLRRLGRLPAGYSSCDVRHFNTVMNAWAERTKRDPEALIMVESLFEEMKATTKHSFHQEKVGSNTINSMTMTGAVPNLSTYNTVLKALANASFPRYHPHRPKVRQIGITSRELSPPEIAENLLSEMDTLREEAEHNNDGIGFPGPDRISYTAVMNAIARRGGPDAPERVTSLLQKMVSTYGITGDNSVLPDSITFNCVIDAWAKSGDNGFNKENSNNKRNQSKENHVGGISKKEKRKSAGERAKDVLYTMEKLYRSGNIDIAPDVVTFNSVINAYASNPNVFSARAALKLLREMESFGGHSSFWWQEEVESDIVASENIPFSAPRVIEADICSYNTVLKAFAKAQEPEAAEELLYSMEKRKKSGLSDIGADIYSYNIVMGAWANSGDSKASKRAESLFLRMEQLYRNGNEFVKPDSTSYNTFILALSRTGKTSDAERATLILDRMYELKRTGRHDAVPTARTYSAAISAWSRCDHPLKAHKARELLLRMTGKSNVTNGGEEDLIALDLDDSGCSSVPMNQIRKNKNERHHHYVNDDNKENHQNNKRKNGPNIYAYANVLNACAYTTGDTNTKWEALKIAVKTYEEMKESSEYIAPNHIIYGTFLMACHRLLDNGNMNENNDNKMKKRNKNALVMRRKLVEECFIECRNAGQVGDYVLRQIHTAAPLDLYEKLIGVESLIGVLTTKDIPDCWSRNVREKNDRYQPSMTGKKRIRGR